MKPDFIGLGVQKSGTSWIYACLYEHPRVCMPKKEIHFFSRERNWKNGYEWYEELFNTRCGLDTINGEFSTTYFATGISAERIKNRYPEVKLIVCLRNPVDRAYSNYINDIKIGEVDDKINFLDAIQTHPEYIDQGRYKKQFLEYFKYFNQNQFLILFYEDIQKDPQSFIKKIYNFLEVDSNFTPSMLETKVNVARIPKLVWLDKIIRTISGFLRKTGIGEKLWWWIKKSSIPNLIRSYNSKSNFKKLIEPKDREQVRKYFLEDIEYVKSICPQEDINW